MERQVPRRRPRLLARRADNVLGDFAQRFLGSPDVYEASAAGPRVSSVNFVTAHDGFTLADLTAYDEKHNEANGEDNNDGESDNRSANHGAEGPTDDAGGQRTAATASAGTSSRRCCCPPACPMILGGDEIGRTQGGNNNAYCQDDEISWFDWNKVDEGLLQFTTELIALRRENPALRPAWFRHAPEAGGADTVRVLRADAEGFTAEDWTADHRAIAFVLEHDGADAFAVLLERGRERRRVHRPGRPRAGMGACALHRPGPARRGAR